MPINYEVYLKCVQESETKHLCIGNTGQRIIKEMNIRDWHDGLFVCLTKDRNEKGRLEMYKVASKS